FGSNIADVLQSIPASQIKSIEVITNPGARYDAEGIGGIINIILKKSTARGINGNLSLSAGTRMENGSMTFNARKGKVGYSLNIGGNARPYFTTLFHADRISTDSVGNQILLHQEGTTRFIRGGQHANFGVDYTIDDKNSISGSIEYDHFYFSGNAVTNQTQQPVRPGGAVPQSSWIDRTANKFLYHEKDASINYKRKFAKEDQELNIGGSTSLGHYKSVADNLEYLLPGDSLHFGTSGVNPGTENESEVTVDYTQPFRDKWSLGVGGKINLRNIGSTADVSAYDPAIGDFVPNPSLSNVLTYHQKIYALYSELTFPVFRLFDTKLGARYERTDINAFYSNVPGKTEIPDYNTLVPSVFFSRKIGDSQQVKFNFSKRIERPEFRDLDPYLNTSDPKNISAGNPFLKPEIGKRFELSYNVDFRRGITVMLGLFYRTSNRDIQPYIVYYPSVQVGDSVYTNVAVNTRQNIGLEKDAGTNLFINIHPSEKLTLRANLFAFHRHTINTIDVGKDVSSFNFRSNINATWQIRSTLAAEFFGNFNSARNEVQGRYPSFTTYTFAIRKQFWKKNGSLGFTATNFFDKYIRQRTELHGTDFDFVSVRHLPFRSFGINFTWKFGKLEFKKDKDEPNQNPAPGPE
ncbi:MAG TPA: outer membrane beta-barrel family protein, partial [Chitinophagaceae bacterium]